MKEPLVSIVLLTWNLAGEAINCMNSLKKQSYKNFEVILVDNGSRKEEVDKLKKYIKGNRSLRIRPVFNKENLGFCEGNNVGVRASKGKYVVFLSDDTILDRNWIKFLVEPFFKGENVGGTASKIVFYGRGKENILQYAGGKIKFYGKPVSEGLTMKDGRQFSQQKQTLWGQGCSIMFPRKVLDELDEYFCKQFFIYYDDVDLCWRVNNLGYKIIYVPRSVVYHKGSVSVMSDKQMSQKQLFLNIRNKYLAFWRNLKILDFLLVFPFVIAYDLVKGFYFMLYKGRTAFYGSRFNYMTSTIKSIFGFFSLMFSVKRPRKGSLSDLDW